MKVLLVEDDEYVAESIRLCLLQAVQCDIHTVYTAVDGLVEYSTGVYSAAVLDLSLPDSPPENTVEAFKEAMHKTPTIAVSGVSSADMGLLAIEHGAVAFVPKPDMTALKTVFVDLLARLSSG